jgi:signal transduction histidine kinase
MTRHLLFLFASFLLFPGSSFSQKTVTFQDIHSCIDLGGSVSILEDQSGTLTPEQAWASEQYKPSTQRIPNMGISNSTFWVKLRVVNATSLKDPLLLLEQPTLDKVTLYSWLPGNSFSETTLGEVVPFSKREFKVPDYIFRLHIPENETATYLLKIRSSDQIQLPLVLGSIDKVDEITSQKNLYSGIYFGILLVMVIYNLFIFFSVRDRNYLYYVVYTIGVAGTQIGLQGQTFQFFWPNSPWIAIHSEFFFPALSGAAGLAFLRVFLRSKEHTPRLYKFSFVLYALYIVGLGLSLFDVFKASYLIIEVTAMLVSGFLLTEAIIIYRMGYRPAKFFLIAWTTFLTGIFIFILKDFEVFPYNTFTRYTMPIGSALEVMLLSFGLADRINSLKKEKEESQAKALSALKENEKIVKGQNVMLETKVKERTNELELSNKELNSTYNHLKETQSQLVDAEKMASLGQLTAGIAHEINNPINFVKSNIKSIKKTVDEIKLMLNKYAEIKPGTLPDEKLKEINALATKLDLSYSLTEIDDLVLGVDDGASRTAEIVKGLRTFSRLGEDVLKTCDIHEGLDSTLILLNSEIKGTTKIEKKYGSLSQIECYPGKLNQVFMNLLNNALQSINEKNIGGNGLIQITTWQDEQMAYISIQDNGIGIKEENLGKVFEPFFTTKTIGQGMGLGLSIAYSIIEKHGGKISVKSEAGKGALFTISLPKQPPIAAS